MGIDKSRRRFFKTAGAAAFTLGALVTGCKDKGLSDKKPFRLTPSDKLSYDNVVYTACGICQMGCAMKVYVKNGRAIYVEGNPADPFNRGHLCPKGKSSLGFLYNNDRLLYPLKRTNPTKGYGVDPQWEQITWDEAFTTLITKITEATESAPGAADFANGEGFAIFSHGPYNWGPRLLSAIGSPNMVTHHDTCIQTSLIARKMLTGGVGWANVANATYILSFGWDQPERASNQITADFTDAVAAGAKVVCFNPYQGGLGSKADTWIPIKPGTDLAVMLAMINHIIDNDLYDATAVARTNFSDHEAAIRAHFAAYTLAWAEGISGVPAATIQAIAEDFAAAQKAVVPLHKRDGAGGPNYRNSYQASHAGMILNALVGAIDRDGGDACLAFGWKPSAPLTMKATPANTLQALIDSKGSIDGKENFPFAKAMTKGIFANVAQRILDENPFKLKMAMLRRYGVLSFPDPDKIAQAFQTLDYLVFADTMPKEVMWYADMVLPEPSYFEFDSIAARGFCTPGKKMVMAGNRVQAPLGDMKGWSAILLELGKRLDQLRFTEYFKLQATDEWVTCADEKNAMADNINAGWTLSDVLSVPNGVWEDTSYTQYTAKTTFGTPSTKIEIYSNKMVTASYGALPVWVTKHATPDSTYPLYLLVMRWAGMKNSAPMTSANPYCLDAFPGPVAVIHPSNAASLGIENGDPVWIESGTGKMKAEVRISQRIRPDCVLTNHNYGHTVSELTYTSQDMGDGPLIADRDEAELVALGDWSGCAWMSDACVKVYKA
jgi:thiosulfate reductase/polysulfide reductase chain A